MGAIFKEGAVLVDAHVHVHECFDLGMFFGSATKNFEKACSELQVEGPAVGLLLLTETSKANHFYRFKQLAEAGAEICGGEKVCLTGEPCSLMLGSFYGNPLYVIAGRQIVTAERLEVLALATERQFMDGAPIAEVINNVTHAGGVAVVPWGFGKWYGKRGRIVDELLSTQEGNGIVLGDNSGRPGFLPEPRQFRTARRNGMAILPGSDPLPFSSEVWRPGSFGFALRGRVSKVTPAADFVQLLRKQSNAIVSYGRLERPFRFLRNQVAMQLCK